MTHPEPDIRALVEQVEAMGDLMMSVGKEVGAHTLFAAASALEQVLGENARLREERDAFRDQAINRGWNWNMVGAHGGEDGYRAMLAREVDRTLDVMLGRKTLAETYRDDMRAAEEAVAALAHGGGREEAAREPNHDIDRRKA